MISITIGRRYADLRLGRGPYRLQFEVSPSFSASGWLFVRVPFVGELCVSEGYKGFEGWSVVREEPVAGQRSVL